MKTDFKKLDCFLDSMPERGIPLCNLAVTVGKDVVYTHSVNCGYDTLFWIYSASKVSVCTAAMRLVEEGKLDLDDPVSRYLPAFDRLSVRTGDGVVPCRTTLRIVHLFTMTGGLDYDMNTPEVRKANEEKKSTTEVAGAIACKPLGFEPGTHYRYSLCHDVLGAVVEAVSGMTLADYLRTNIFAPLGMENTGFDPSPEQYGRFAPLYSYSQGTGRSEPREPLVRPYENPNYFSGGGGLFSSTEDYIRLMRTLALGGTSPEGYALLKEETVAMMEENRLSQTCLSEFRGGRLYGYGWGLCGRCHMDPAVSLSRSSVGEFGWDSATCHFAGADRAKGIGFFFGTHVFGCGYGYNVLHPVIRNLVYEALGY